MNEAVGGGRGLRRSSDAGEQGGRTCACAKGARRRCAECAGSGLGHRKECASVRGLGVVVAAA